jgi:hypothetical protein
MKLGICDKWRLVNDCQKSIYEHLLTVVLLVVLRANIELGWTDVDWIKPTQLL